MSPTIDTDLRAPMVVLVDSPRSSALQLPPRWVTEDRAALRAIRTALRADLAAAPASPDVVGVRVSRAAAVPSPVAVPLPWPAS